MQKKRMQQDQLEDLGYELISIAFWDESYERGINQNVVETTAWEARRRRVREIAEQLNRDGLARVVPINALAQGRSEFVRQLLSIILRKMAPRG